MEQLTIKPHQVSVRLYTPITQGKQYTSTLTRWMADDYKHSTRLHGGYWTASFGIIKNAPALQAFFTANLFGHVETKVGSYKVWEGFISEMELTYQGITRRMSIQNIRNAVNCTYTDTADDERKTTAWYTNDSSIEKFGRMEETVYLDNVELSAADAYAQTVLAEQAWPYPEVVSIGKEVGEVTLHIQCSGYVFTANNKYISVGAGANDIAVFVVNTINADCEFIEVGSIQANAVQIDKPVNDVRGWDFIMQMVEIGDGTNPFRAWVGDTQHMSYEEMDNTPNIGWRNGKIIGRAGSQAPASKWMITPGVIRDYNWPQQTLPAEMFLDDARDSLISEVEVSEKNELPSLKTDTYEESDFIAELNRNMPKEEDEE